MIKILLIYICLWTKLRLLERIHYLRTKSSKRLPTQYSIYEQAKKKCFWQRQKGLVSSAFRSCSYLCRKHIKRRVDGRKAIYKKKSFLFVVERLSSRDGKTLTWVVAEHFAWARQDNRSGCAQYTNCTNVRKKSVPGHPGYQPMCILQHVITFNIQLQNKHTPDDIWVYINIAPLAARMFIKCLSHQHPLILTKHTILKVHHLSPQENQEWKHKQPQPKPIKPSKNKWLCGFRDFSPNVNWEKKTRKNSSTWMVIPSIPKSKSDFLLRTSSSEHGLRPFPFCNKLENYAYDSEHTHTQRAMITQVARTRTTLPQSHRRTK